MTLKSDLKAERAKNTVDMIYKIVRNYPEITIYKLSYLLGIGRKNIKQYARGDNVPMPSLYGKILLLHLDLRNIYPLWVAATEFERKIFQNFFNFVKNYMSHYKKEATMLEHVKLNREDLAHWKGNVNSFLAQYSVSAEALQSYKQAQESLEEIAKVDQSGKTFKHPKFRKKVEHYLAENALKGNPDVVCYVKANNNNGLDVILVEKHDDVEKNKMIQNDIFSGSIFFFYDKEARKLKFSSSF